MDPAARAVAGTGRVRAARTHPRAHHARVPRHHQRVTHRHFSAAKKETSSSGQPERGGFLLKKMFYRTSGAMHCALRVLFKKKELRAARVFLKRDRRLTQNFRSKFARLFCNSLFAASVCHTGFHTFQHRGRHHFCFALCVTVPRCLYVQYDIFVRGIMSD